MSNAVDKEVDDLEIDDSEKTEKQDKGETEEREEGDETLEQEEGETLEQDNGETEEGETEEQEDEGDEKTLEQDEEGDETEQEEQGEEEIDEDNNEDDEIEEIEEQGEEIDEDNDEDEEEEQEQGNNNEDNEHLLKNCLMATIRIPIRIDKDGSFDMINHYGEIKIEEMSDIPIKNSDSLYTKLLAYIRENPEYLAKIMKEFESESDQQEQESVTEITPELFNFSNQKTREKPLNTSFRSKTIKSKNFTKKNYKSDDKE